MLASFFGKELRVKIFAVPREDKILRNADCAGAASSDSGVKANEAIGVINVW